MRVCVRVLCDLVIRRCQCEMKMKMEEEEEEEQGEVASYLWLSAYLREAYLLGT